MNATPLFSGPFHHAVRLEVPKGAKLVHQDVVLVPGKKAKVRVVEPDGLPAKGAIVEGASEGWEAEVVLEGNELDVVGLGGTNRPPRLVLARDATGTRGRAPG